MMLDVYVRSIFIVEYMGIFKGRYINID